MYETLFDYNVLHVPKTAGLSVKDLANQVKLPRLNMVSGFGEGPHPPLYLVKEYLPAVPHLFMVRDPVEWFASWFWFHMPPNNSVSREDPNYLPDPLFEVISLEGVLEVNASVERLYALIDNNSLADLVSTEIRKHLVVDNQVRLSQGHSGFMKQYALRFSPVSPVRTVEHAFMFANSGLGLYNWNLALHVADSLLEVVQGGQIDPNNRVWFDSADFDTQFVPWLQAVYPEADWGNYTPQVINTTEQPVALTAESVALIRAREDARPVL